MLVLLCAPLLFCLLAAAQIPPVTHNTWTSGAPIPVGVFGPATAFLKGQIYLVGGYSGLGPENITQVVCTDACPSKN
jgi:hypothetical protein